MTGSLCVPSAPCQGKPIGRVSWRCQQDKWSCADSRQEYTAPPRGGGHQGFSLTSPLHGVTFLAFGNGAPDVFSAVVAFSDPRTAGLAIGAVFGKGAAVPRPHGVILWSCGMFLCPERAPLCWQVPVCL